MMFRSTVILRLSAALLLVSGLAAAQDADGPTPQGKGKAKPAAAAKAPRKPKAKPVPAPERMDLNTATRDQLKSLPGITDEYAGRIIAGRPYQVRTQLATRNILPQGVYVSINKLVTAIPPKK